MEIAIMDTMSKNGNLVTMLFCDKAFKICKLNQDGNVDRCDLCINFSDNAFKKISHRIEKLQFRFETIEAFYNKNSLTVPTVNNIDQLIGLKYKNFNCGKAIYSTLIDDFTKDLDVNDPSIAAKIQMYFILSICFYENILDIIKSGKYDVGLVFNGRHPYEAAFIQAFKDLSLDYITHERGTSPHKIGFFYNRLPHSNHLDAKKAEVTNTIPSDSKKYSDIKDYLQNPLRAYPTHTYTNKQKIGEFITQRDKKIVTLFLSTEDEFVSIHDQESPPSFYEIISKIILNFQQKDLDKYLLIIRDHPNSASNSQENVYKNLVAPFNNILYFSPSSSIDTYECIKQSEFVVTVGSTAGLEAMNMGKKVVCLVEFSSYSANLPGVLVYNPLLDNLKKLVNFINLDISKEKIQESVYRFVSSKMSNDISIKGWMPYLGHSKKDHELLSRYIIFDN
jgi:hypothetical protein